MTNYEWIVTNEKEIIETILAEHLGKQKGKIIDCDDIACRDCDFASSPNSIHSCGEVTKEWLKAEYEPLYKKGDIVLAYETDILVIKDINDHTVLLVNRLKAPYTTYKTDIKDIIKKVGNIYDK